MKLIIIAVLAVSALAVLSAMKKSGHFFKSLIVSALQGLAAMMAVNVVGLASGVTLAMNWYTMGAVSIFGIPCCIALTVLKLIFR